MEKVFEKLTNLFELGTFVSYKKLNEGVLNDNYVIATDKDQYFIKGIRSKVKDRVPYIANVEKWMFDHGIPCVAMIGSMHDDCLYCIYPYLESDREHSYTQEDYIRMGEMLGRIHNATKDSVPESLKKYEFKKPSDAEVKSRYEKYADYIEKKNVFDDIDREFIDYIELKMVLTKKWDRVENLKNDRLIHGDYHAGNLLIHKDSREIIGVCDWEKAEFGPSAYELARSVLYAAFDHSQDDDKWEVIAKGFLKGYRSVAEISNDEFILGMKMRLHRHLYSAWLEEKYYRDNDSRANHLIKNEIRILKYFIQGDGFKKLESIL